MASVSPDARIPRHRAAGCRARVGQPINIGQGLLTTRPVVQLLDTAFQKSTPLVRSACRLHTPATRTTIRSGRAALQLVRSPRRAESRVLLRQRSTAVAAALKCVPVPLLRRREAAAPRSMSLGKRITRHAWRRAASASSAFLASSAQSSSVIEDTSLSLSMSIEDALAARSIRHELSRLFPAEGPLWP